MLDTKKLWRDTLESIKVSVSPAIFSTWFSQTFLAKIEKQGTRFVIEVGCASPFIKTTIESRYFGMLQDSLVKSLEASCDLTFVVRQNPDKKTFEHTLDTPLFQKDDKEEINEAFLRTHIRPGFTFENFAVSSSNQMAHAAAEAVSNTPGSAYNPLFIWGGVGVGKTHLMLAIGYCLLAENPLAKILFVSGEEFTNGIVEGIRNKTTTAFRDKYRRLKALLIDDIQFIAGKDAVQEEFFHTFNALTNAGGQVIMTSDKPPSDISKLEERLKSRFEAGLIVDIAPPDFELRCAITQIKSKERGIELPMDLVQVIAANIDAARPIEGFLVKLASQARLRKTEISEDLVNSLIGKGAESIALKIRAKPLDVISAVAKHFSVGKKYLLGESRVRPIARPRQILMYLLRRELGLPLTEVGRLVGGRDHTTVMHAVEKITHLASEDVQIREDLLGIKNSL
ncbi:chromosomal replication initiator protein DnaA [Candidatus Woesebacteria bacterium RBG_19FT_COMBO_42_9]|uniref:Chromosomal replication initiator protein DnaA n=1 Tax=Candidatus Woesebacteria bacterium RBG_16_42_24 TaxID=1802485 RepID=A0A1F7XM11_9BACT|nr:MAG: chromosomal replication initiator protein DnaA [Candidatus Woesebacteria bacterium RBG_16_42_24]OGM17906.1 MAG: chromosomal replication initiator protein DnaA [Candidatus Woesebacteria bacterium RBG_19FT_COMBO_42_9]OGM68247.1 MAG: chromosomal replication initiator protein DnaA [Candidatus Woesebacteria bacterium RIFCSPLOWO2_01_FULL_43_11]